MNTRQALTLPGELDVAVSHPDDEAGSTERFVDREELKTITERTETKAFPSPTTDVEGYRFKEAARAVRTALDDLVALANEAGWGTAEIIIAIVDAGEAMKQANIADADPTEDPLAADEARGQVGHGEQYV